jgi:hypothetical protein
MEKETGSMKLRFLIRDLLWLTLVVGMAVAWWVDHRQQKYRPYNVKNAEAIRDITTGEIWVKTDRRWEPLQPQIFRGDFTN